MNTTELNSKGQNKVETGGDKVNMKEALQG
jgi:hypothetical protein